MADSARMLSQCVERQQRHAPNVLEAQSRGSEDTSWKVSNPFIAQTDRGIEGVHDLPPEEHHPVVG
jgi:hypothetical protein